MALRVHTRLQQVGTLWFNAGELENSIALAVEDYFRIVGDGCCADIATPMAITA